MSKNDLFLWNNLSAGQVCPEGCGGRLVSLTPGTVLRFKGQSDLHIINYQLEKLRCSLCGKLWTADLPEEAGTEKYDERLKAQLTVKKYYLGTAFHATERYHAIINQPLSDSLQWTLVEAVADAIYPVYHQLEKQLAQAKLVYYDDTRARILSHYEYLKLNPETKRKGAYTTAMLGEVEGHPIILFCTGLRHAGENLARLLDKRQADLPPVITMNDALAANQCHDKEATISYCMAHALRKFIDIENKYPEKCEMVIDAISSIYTLENETKAMTGIERLAYHQRHSLPILDDREAWFKRQFADKHVERNSHLGFAINYCIKHWEGLTAFCRVQGTPIDNNSSERALKLPIRSRKNAYFF